jgi:hypothetical protein
MLIPGKSREPVRRMVNANASGSLEDPAFSCFVSSEAQFRDMLLLEVNRGCPMVVVFARLAASTNPRAMPKLKRCKTS